MKPNQNSLSTRLLILDAANRVILDNGTNALTLDAVTKQAGVSKGGLLYHFPNKESLIIGMVERFIAEFDTAIVNIPILVPLESRKYQADCGTYFHYELTRCPNCGVNIYEPEADQEPSRLPSLQENWFSALIRRLTNKPHPADELFGSAINQVELFNNLLSKVGGSRTAAERLIEFERQKNPQGTRITWLNQAIQHWERDNRSPRTE